MSEPNITGMIAGVVILASPIYALIQNAVKKGRARNAAEAAFAINTNVLHNLQDFHPAVSFVGGAGEDAIGLDDKREMLAIVKAGVARRLAFNQIVSVQIMKDGEAFGSSDLGNGAAGAAAGAVIGSALFGGAGLIAGMIAGKSRGFKSVKKLSLKLYTTDVVSPVLDVTFLENADGLPRNSVLLAERVKVVDEWCARLHATMRTARAHVPGYSGGAEQPMLTR